ncbi:GLUT4 regulating protein TUG [Penicillium angulare]|uniref:GLUT4 regulating protein TUG n=1 Tax=Penicillium angulare TaxID=116970 RepID=UPI0025416532|nr:GLUT4 regulating protein TUG [Penicillium angulare]KAJ5281587.1 GLUT4 regulating protein TUG [Penicillium angulare]
MSAHVVVIDSTARRATVKTTPAKHLTDILQEACTKFGYNSNQYALKHNRKQLDMSLSFRLSGLTTGAKLELVQLSRSPSVVTVALQLPESEARGAPNGRILDKFPSTTTLWLVLRNFEAGVAGSTVARNLTARGVPAADGGDSGAGRLYYEVPVLRVLERELSSFTDLQKSLAQLGFNSGNILIRLSFRRTEEPLEEAMVKIGEYFKLSGDDTPMQQPTQTTAAPPAIQNNENTAPQHQDSTTQPEPEQSTFEPATAPEAAPEQTGSASNRSVTVFSPPSENIPLSAQLSYNEADYIPSVEHAKAHQRQLNEASRPQRLPTDAEIAAKTAAEDKRRADIREIDVKIRFPDQSQVVAKFGTSDSGQSLHGFVRSCLSPTYGEINFALNAFAAAAPGRAGHANVIPDTEFLLIKDLRLQGRVLVNFTWADNASSATHQQRSEILRPELRSQAQQLKIEQPPEIIEEAATSKPEPGPSGSSDTGKPGAKKGMPKWLKLGKK